tara:strand:- start:19897 stop:20148 length:252 start_codon:yes stop_codon:yes gene_type:complete
MRKAIIEEYKDYPGLLFMDGLDDAIIGVANLYDNPTVVYSSQKVLENLVARGMGFYEAKEFMSFNIMDAYLGKFTPIIIDDLF